MNQQGKKKEAYLNTLEEFTGSSFWAVLLRCLKSKFFSNANDNGFEKSIECTFGQAKEEAAANKLLNKSN